MKSKAGIIGIIVLFTLLCGCEKLGIHTRASKKQVVDEYLATAQAYERKGDLVEAIKQYQLVLSVDPENQAARDKTTQIGQKLRKLAENHYQSGLTHYHKGQYKLARHEFATAIRYDPDHQQAEKMLNIHRELQQIDRFVLHTIQPNDSLSTLAVRYYGDYQKFHLIANYNDLEDAAKVTVGQKIKIPVLAGMPIMADPAEIQTYSGKAIREKPAEIIAVKGFIIHTVQAEETLSLLAKKYYDDSRKYDLIAKFNEMSVTQSLRIGQEIKIPEVEGLPFLAPEIAKKTEDSMETESIPAAEKKPPKKPPIETVAIPSEEPLVEAEVVPATVAPVEAEIIPPKEAPVEAQILPPKEALVEPEVEKDEPSQEHQADAHRKLGIESFNKENFADAINQLQKALNMNPDDKIAKNYLSLAYFEQGYVSFNKADYSQAITSFERSLQYDPKCKRCDLYIKLSAENFKDLHYRKGITFFGEKNLAQAIDEWELVYNVDPTYKEVDEKLKKAKILINRQQKNKPGKMGSE